MSRTTRTPSMKLSNRSKALNITHFIVDSLLFIWAMGITGALLYVMVTR